MITITLNDDYGTAHKAAFRAIKDCGDATIGLATLECDGETYSIPAVVYGDGTIISAADWYGLTMDDDEIVEEASNPTWAHHWTGANGESVVILDGLPRIVG